MKKIECRLCKSRNLRQFLDLGYQPHADQFRDNIDEPETWYPLRVNYCEACGFVQLSHVVSPETLYQKDYLYESSITATAAEHWSEFASTVSKKVPSTGRRALDIGSNDGTLLSYLEKEDYVVMGIDPCKEVADIARERGIPTMCNFFSSKPFKVQFHLVTATNVFAHIDDLDEFMKEVDKVLADKGVFVFESPYLPNLLSGLEEDTIYHQHLSYLSLRPLVPFFMQHGFDIFDVELHALHGGVFRVYVCRQNEREIKPSVRKLMDKENINLSVLNDFCKRVEEHKNQIYDKIVSIKRFGQNIVAVSAPAKGQTYLNYTGIGRFIDYVTEKSLLKIGRYTPGTHLKIYPDSKLIEDQPDFALILAWNFEKEIRANNKEYKGKWIIPKPTIRIVDSNA